MRNLYGVHWKKENIPRKIRIGVYGRRTILLKSGEWVSGEWHFGVVCLIQNCEFPVSNPTDTRDPSTLREFQWLSSQIRTLDDWGYFLAIGWKLAMVPPSNWQVKPKCRPRDWLWMNFVDIVDWIPNIVRDACHWNRTISLGMKEN